jgi:beta-fructofuranosidase
VLRLASSWVWDCWVADDAERYHLFFLKASRALLDPERRHRRASIGHAVSSDLHTWQELPDALVAADAPAYDDLATWTGSVVRADDGSWRMFYTGLSQRDDGLRQRVVAARSDDLVVWERLPLVLEADPRWYEMLDRSIWYDQAWRDPWVFRDPDGDGWHMFLTGRAAATEPRGRRAPWEPRERGVVAHATSPDLETWQVRPPLSEPGGGFGQLEVPSVQVVDGRPVLVFSCLATEMSDARRASDGGGGIWAVPADSLTGPFDLSRATLLSDHRRYAGHLVQDRAGKWVLVAFQNVDDDGVFVGVVADPVPVGWAGDRLVVTE